MQARNENNQGFDDFRRERKRLQAKRPQASALGYENKALQELEQVEAREVLDQQLTREVHEFFATATRQAAGIVERVARDAEVEAGARVEQEMEAFLIDALSRMNTFVVTVLQHKRGPVAETEMEPKVANLVGRMLDEFRNEGTAELFDKHIGQDPFATQVDEVQREFRSVAADPADQEGEAVPIEQHMVAALDEAASEPVEPAVPVEPRAAAPRPPEPRAATLRAPTPGPAPVPAPSPESAPLADLERFKTALKALVRQGVMNREEARAAWQARLQAMGLQS